MILNPKTIYHGDNPCYKWNTTCNKKGVTIVTPPFTKMNLVLFWQSNAYSNRMVIHNSIDTPTIGIIDLNILF